MSNMNNIYKAVFYLVAIFYLCFYLLSPFFHFHPDDFSKDYQEKYHSHLFSENYSNKSDRGTYHILENETGHNHSLIINTVTTLYAPRNSINISRKITYFELPEPTFKNPVIYTNGFFKFLYSKHKWKKCVHSASNVSPPTAHIV